MTTVQKDDLKIGLAFLGDVQLDVSMEAEQFTDVADAGPRLGGGYGTVSGPKLVGKVRWDFYEEIGDAYCTNTLAGYIDTDDGARINYATRGHALVPDKAGDPNSWSMTHSVLFTTEDERYKWLDKQLGVWHGEWHFGLYQHNYKAYASTLERVAPVASDAPAAGGPAGTHGPVC